MTLNTQRNALPVTVSLCVLIMETTEPTIIFLTGLGADHRLFKYQTAAFPRSIALDWIDPKPGETLEEYAVRLADSLPKPSPPIIICGLSLGGMIAPYIVRHLGAAACILLCTVREPKQFPGRYYPAWLLIRICPPLLWAVMFVAQFFARQVLLPFRIRPEMIGQFVETKTSRLVHLTRMMLDWAYCRRKSDTNIKIPTFQIHGMRDKLLPIQCVAPDVRIEQGGHLLPLSHPQEINALIQQTISNLTVPAELRGNL